MLKKYHTNLYGKYFPPIATSRYIYKKYVEFDPRDVQSFNDIIEGFCRVHGCTDRDIDNASMHRKAADVNHFIFEAEISLNTFEKYIKKLTVCKPNVFAKYK